MLLLFAIVTCHFPLKKVFTHSKKQRSCAEFQSSPACLHPHTWAGETFAPKLSKLLSGNLISENGAFEVIQTSPLRRGGVLQLYWLALRLELGKTPSNSPHFDVLIYCLACFLEDPNSLRGVGGKSNINFPSFPDDCLIYSNEGARKMNASVEISSSLINLRPVKTSSPGETWPPWPTTCTGLSPVAAACEPETEGSKPKSIMPGMASPRVRPGIRPFLGNVAKVSPGKIKISNRQKQNKVPW